MTPVICALPSWASKDAILLACRSFARLRPTLMSGTGSQSLSAASYPGYRRSSCAIGLVIMIVRAHDARIAMPSADVPVSDASCQARPLAWQLPRGRGDTTNAFTAARVSQSVASAPVRSARISPTVRSWLVGSGSGRCVWIS